jgi:hypothetical protein
MSVTDLADWDSRTRDDAESDELLAIDEFIAAVLRRANESVEPLRSPGEHRTILRVAHLFADDLARTKRAFDRVQFIETVMGDRSDA